MEAGHYSDTLDELERVVEALLWVAEEPVRPRRIAQTYAEVTGASEPSDEEIVASIEQLNHQYEQRRHAVQIFQWAGGYRLATHQDVSPFVQAFKAERRERKLSRSLMETLAIIAYKQPTTRPEVDAVRGVDSDYSVRKLLDLGLVTVKGRSESLGRPLLYGTTDKFLDSFGLGTINDLPDLREIAEILNEPAFSKERLELLTLQQMDEATSDSAAPSEENEKPHA